MLTNCLRYFAADATADIILLYPKLTCSILTIMDYFSFIWLGVSLATLVFFRALREYQPNIYISMNHDRLSLVLNLGSLVLIASAILVQVQVDFFPFTIYKISLKGHVNYFLLAGLKM